MLDGEQEAGRVEPRLRLRRSRRRRCVQPPCSGCQAKAALLTRSNSALVGAGRRTAQRDALGHVRPRAVGRRTGAAHLPQLARLREARGARRGRPRAGRSPCAHTRSARAPPSSSARRSSSAASAIPFPARRCRGARRARPRRTPRPAGSRWAYPTSRPSRGAAGARPGPAARAQVPQDVLGQRRRAVDRGRAVDSRLHLGDVRAASGPRVHVATQPRLDPAPYRPADPGRGPVGVVVGVLVGLPAAVATPRPRRLGPTNL